jgi:hypothetical protein
MSRPGIELRAPTSQAGTLSILSSHSIYREFELFKIDRAFMFSRISFSILDVFSAYRYLLDYVPNFVKTVKNDKGLKYLQCFRKKY